MTTDTYIEAVADSLQTIEGDFIFKTHKRDFIAGFNAVTQQNDLFRDLDNRVDSAKIGVLTYDLLKYIKNTTNNAKISPLDEWSANFLDENISKQCKAIGILIALQSEGTLDSKFVISKKSFEAYKDDLEFILTQTVKGNPDKLQVKDAITPIKIEKFDSLDLIFIGQSFNIGMNLAIENLKKYYKSKRRSYLLVLKQVISILDTPKGFLDRKFTQKIEKDKHSLLKGYLLTLDKLTYELELPKGHILLNYFLSYTSKDGLSNVIDLNHFYKQEETFKEFLVNIEAFETIK